jgi:hypothetical protein
VQRPRRRPKPIRWLRERLGETGTRALLIGVLVLAAAGLLAWALVSGPLSNEEEPGETRVVTVEVESDQPSEAPVGPLGFPLVATRNTTRVGGADAAEVAAAVALATHPPSPDAPEVKTALIVNEDEWQAAIAAAALVGPPLRSPLLVGAPSELPEPTRQALAQLKPSGSAGRGDRVGAYTIGDVAGAAGLEASPVKGDTPAALAGAIEELRGRLIDSEPGAIVIASQEEPAFAMPAAAWAARSTDPVLFSGRDRVPPETVSALRRHAGVPVYVLGGQTVISDDAVRQIRRVSSQVQRVGADQPIANAIEFARYADGSFGWDINDPGHGLVIANSSRPLDAGAAAALSASGEWGPLLVTDRSDDLPAELTSFLLDIKPGYENDPTRAVYNHIWLIGDTAAIGARVQAEIDDLAEVAEIGPGEGGPVIEAPQGQPGQTHAEPEAQPRGKGGGKP